MTARILDVARSTISLQKPVVRPSMIVLVAESKRATAVTTLWLSRAFLSVRPTCAYSGSVKLPSGFTGLPAFSFAPRMRWWRPQNRPVLLEVHASSVYEARALVVADELDERCHSCPVWFSSLRNRQREREDLASRSHSLQMRSVPLPKSRFRRNPDFSESKGTRSRRCYITN
jgi:hypothetical protein